MDTTASLTEFDAVLRDENGRVLIQRNHQGGWSLPAGAIEPGEAPAHPHLVARASFVDVGGVLLQGLDEAVDDAVRELSAPFSCAMMTSARRASSCATSERTAGWRQ